MCLCRSVLGHNITLSFAAGDIVSSNTSTGHRSIVSYNSIWHFASGQKSTCCSAFLSNILRCHECDGQLRLPVPPGQALLHFFAQTCVPSWGHGVWRSDVRHVARCTYRWMPRLIIYMHMYAAPWDYWSVCTGCVLWNSNYPVCICTAGLCVRLHELGLCIYVYIRCVVAAVWWLVDLLFFLYPNESWKCEVLES